SYARLQRTVAVGPAGADVAYVLLTTFDTYGDALDRIRRCLCIEPGVVDAVARHSHDDRGPFEINSNPQHRDATETCLALTRQAILGQSQLRCGALNLPDNDIVVDRRHSPLHLSRKFLGISSGQNHHLATGMLIDVNTAEVVACPKLRFKTLVKHCVRRLTSLDLREFGRGQRQTDRLRTDIRQAALEVRYVGRRRGKPELPTCVNRRLKHDLLPGHYRRSNL